MASDPYVNFNDGESGANVRTLINKIGSSHEFAFKRISAIANVAAEVGYFEDNAIVWADNENAFYYYNGSTWVSHVALNNFVKKTGDIIARLAITDIYHIFGGFNDKAETITVGVGDWNHITNAGTDLWAVDNADGITYANDVFTIVNTGDYFGTLSLSVSAINGKDFHIRVYNNTQASVEGRVIGFSTTGAGNEMNVTLLIHIEATAGDAIQFEIMSADGTNPVVDDGLFSITYLHG